MDTERDLIDAWVAEGRVKRVPTGESGIVRKPKKPERPTRFRPEHCGKGSAISRHRFLDEIDGDWQ